MDVMTVKHNKTAVNVTPVQRVSNFRKDTGCVKSGWYIPFKIQHSLKITIFAHPAQKCARDCCHSYGSNVLPNGYSTSVHTFVRHADSPQLEFWEK